MIWHYLGMAHRLDNFESPPGRLRLVGWRDWGPGDVLEIVDGFDGI